MTPATSGPDGPADPRRRRRLMSPGMVGATAASSMPAHGIAAESSAVRAGRRIDQDFAPAAAQSLEPHPPASASPAFVEWVLGSSRSATLAFVDTEIDADNRRDVRPQSVECGFRLPCRLCRYGGAPSAIGRAIVAIHRSQRHARGSGRARERVAAVEQGWRGLGSLRAMRTQLELPPGSAAEVVFFLGEAATREDARAAIVAIRAADLDALEADIARTGMDFERDRGQDSRPVDGPHAQWLAALPDARMPYLGALGVLSGKRRLWFPRPIAGRHGSAHAARRSDARTPAPRRGAPVR